MTLPGVSRGEPQATNHAAVKETHRSLVSTALFWTALLAVFWGLLQLDLPLARYMRSLHFSWLEQIGDVGNRLGSGAVLVAISGILLVSGLLLKSSALRAAGVESLLAHAIAGLTVQAIKHVIGRPRPRFVHGDDGFLFGPSFDSGLDSFPSGHAAASFAVATVLVRRCPKSGWILYGTATMVALSRIVRGSHFPTDVMFGVVLGILAGYLTSSPFQNWRSSLLQALTMGTPFLVAVFALIWIVVCPSFEGPITLFMMFAGVLSLAAAMYVRLYPKLRAHGPVDRKILLGVSEANVLITVGLALTTGSMLVAIVTVLVSVAYWLRLQHSDVTNESHMTARSDPSPDACLTYQMVFTEVGLAVMLLGGVVLIQQMKGRLPLLS